MTNDLSNLQASTSKNKADNGNLTTDEATANELRASTPENKIEDPDNASATTEEHVSNLHASTSKNTTDNGNLTTDQATANQLCAATTENIIEDADVLSIAQEKIVDHLWATYRIDHGFNEDGGYNQYFFKTINQFKDYLNSIKARKGEASDIKINTWNFINPEGKYSEVEDFTKTISLKARVSYFSNTTLTPVLPHSF